MKTETTCPICGAVVEHNLPPGEDFECPNCKATVIVPDPKEREEWPEPAVGDPTFTPDRRAALLRALRAEHESGELPEGSEAFVASMFSPSRLEAIGKRAKSGADLSEADALYGEEDEEVDELHGVECVTRSRSSASLAEFQRAVSPTR